jgi:phospholipid-binding lipoprotein MlaA
VSRRRCWSESKRPLRRAAVAAIVLLLDGCAAAPPAVGPPGKPARVTAASPIDVYDPLEGLNRQTYKFNAEADRYVLLPIVDAYEFLVPPLFRDRISEFFTNLATPITLANQLLQLKFADALATVLRFGANTTFGMLGFVDIASAMGLPKYNEDFGQTLGFWGVDAGGYLVLPILGPSSFRDAAGTGVDLAVFSVVDPLGAFSLGYGRPAVLAVNGIDMRYRQPFRYYESGSPFEYLLVRYVYTKKREIEIGQRAGWLGATDGEESDGEQRELASGSRHAP